ncbi:hypothetical protein [Calothrix sp. NIES-2100]
MVSNELKIAVIAGDIKTNLDDQILRTYHVNVIAINTGIIVI